MADVDRDAIAARAYALYVRGGRRPGRALDDWIEAERQLKAEQSGAGPSALAGAVPPAKTLVPGAPVPTGRPAAIVPPASAPAVPVAHAQAATSAARPAAPAKAAAPAPSSPAPAAAKGGAPGASKGQGQGQGKSQGKGKGKKR